MGKCVLHLTVTFTNLSGSRENLDKTIRYLLENNWTAGNTSGLTPFFESDTEEPDQLARSDNSAVNLIMIGFFSRERMDDRDFSGDSKHTWKQMLLVEIQAENLNVLTLFEDEVNRILWENTPNSSTRLNKSDGSASEAAEFEDSELSFVRLEPEGDEDITPTSQSQLSILYYKVKT